MARKRVTARKRPTVEDVQTTLLRAVSQEYQGDRSAPGIVAAIVPSGQFYVSVCRYQDEGGRGKVVVAKAYAATLLEALTRVGSEWLAVSGGRRDLAAMVKR